MQKIGLVLAGGMAKGAFQIGLLKALNEYFTPEDFQIISCSSIGVLNGYAFATNQIDEGIEMWKNIIPDNKRVYVTKMFKIQPYKIASLSFMKTTQMLKLIFMVRFIMLQNRL